MKEVRMYAQKFIDRGKVFAVDLYYTNVHVEFLYLPSNAKQWTMLERAP